MRATRGGSALVAAAVFVVLLAPFVARAQTACPGVTDAGDWTSIPGPRFPSGPATISEYAVDAVAPTNLYVTNGRVVMRSDDFGCTWALAYRLPQEPGLSGGYSDDNAAITQIVVSEHGSAHRRVLLLIEETLLGTPRPHVVRSDDGGRHWDSADTGMPVQGRATELAVAPSQPQLAYLSVDNGGGAVDSLYASTDGGSSWALRSDPSRGAPPGGTTGLAIDPLQANSLWAWGSQGLHHSTDGGRSFAAVRDFARVPAGPADVFHASGAPARIVAFRPTEGEMLVSDDGGRNWDQNTGPRVDAIAHGASADEMMVTTGGSAFVFYPPTSSWVDVDAPRAGATDVVADRLANPRFYVRTAGTIDVYTGEKAGRVVDDELPPKLAGLPAIIDPGDLKERPAVLGPDDKQVRIKAGRSKQVHYRLELPPTPLPVDVYFLVDTSWTMRTEIEALRGELQKIAEELALARLDVHFGLGQFRAYPDRFPPRENETNFVLRQEMDVADDLQQLHDELESLTYEDSGGQYDAQLGALWHTATGAGADLYPPGPLGHDVPPGLDAHWREITEESARVIILATDEPFGKNTGARPSVGDFKNPEPPDIPTPDEVIAALNADDAVHVGIALYDRSLTPELQEDLQTVSRGTGGLAPTGVDCDGDGAADIDGGAPLVCKIQSRTIEQASNVGSAVVSLVRAAASREEVSLEAGGPGAGLVRAVTPPSYSGVLLQSSNVLDFDVVYACPQAKKPLERTVTLRASTAGRVVDSATTKIACVTEDQPVIDPFEAAVLGLVAPLAPPPPPAPNVTSASQSQTQAQSQAQAQGAAAHQEEEQPQAAFAQAYDAWQEQLANEQLMVAYRREPVWMTAPALVLGAGAVMLGFAFGLASALRTRIRPAYDHSTRPRR